MRSALTAASLLFTWATAALGAADVTLTLNGAPAAPGDVPPATVQSLILDNGLLRIAFGHDANGDISATSVIAFGQELAHNLHGVEPRDVDAHRTFYLDSNAGKGHLVTSTVRIVKVSPELCHFAVVDDRDLHLEHHFVMLRGEPGVHPYVIIKSQPMQQTGETRTMYRFDMDILDHAWTPERTGMQPRYALLQSISERGNMGDETWRLPDGTIYQKYDYSLYYAEAPMWGHYGAHGGQGFGAWFIPVSTESYAGGPLRQELAVHQDALILNYIGGGHYAGGGTAAGRTGEKIHGPWYLYFNHGPAAETLIADALATAKGEKLRWPYGWMEEPFYPVARGTVHGQLKLASGGAVAGAWVALGQPANGGGRGAGSRPGGGRGRGGAGVPDRAAVLYTQAGDYIYYGRADTQGHFTLPAVRPGSYTLYAWGGPGPVTGSLAVDGVQVKPADVDLGEVRWEAPDNGLLLWQIGVPDRMAGEFKFGQTPRTNQRINEVPANLTYTIGQSHESSDWYYAQRNGTWTVRFDLAEALPARAHLTIAVAGGSGDVTIALNGAEVGTLSLADDASVRRAANRSGRYARFEYEVPGSALRAGPNALTLAARSPGLMYDALVLEGR